MKRSNGIKIASLVLCVICLATSVVRPVNGASLGVNVTKGAAELTREAHDAIMNIEIENTTQNEPQEQKENEVNSEGITLNIVSTKPKVHEGTILNGVYAEDIDLSGKTYEDAVSEIDGYIANVANSSFTLKGINGQSQTVSAKDFNLKWDDTGMLDEAFNLGTVGNLVQRYKARKDLEHEKKVYPIDFSYDEGAIRNVVQTMADAQNIESENATLKRENGSFYFEQGKPGTEIDVDTSVKSIERVLDSFKGGDQSVDLTVIESTPKGSQEDLSKIKDVLGTFTTSFSSSGSDRSGNVRNGASLINGSILYPGEQFSVYNAVSPFTEENGYFMAGSYLNGMVVESLGGGICQVSSTLYNAVLRAELQVDERYNHSMIVTYVKMSSDAAISGTSKDFKFTNNLEYPIYIEGYTTEDKQITFNIYGVETRPSNRTLEFESVEISRTEPEGEKIVADAGQPIGSISVQSPHTGYQGEFWKIVKVDGVETERVLINKSKYLPTPRTATVGTASAAPGAAAAMAAAIATGSIDFVKSTIASLNSAAAAAAAGLPVPEVKLPEAPQETQEAAPAPEPAAESEESSEGTSE